MYYEERRGKKYKKAWKERRGASLVDDVSNTKFHGCHLAENRTRTTIAELLRFRIHLHGGSINSGTGNLDEGFFP
jgi:hypothetical protein